MKLLITHAVPTFERYNHPALGRLVTPRHFDNVDGMVATGIVWAADNDAFSGFNESAFRTMLDAIDGAPGCLFVTAPDVVADAAATLALYHEWGPYLRGRGYPAALVLQDGMSATTMPWDDVDAVFVGGTTTWKLGFDARRIIHEANQRGLWVHMGRVNTLRRIQYARAAGCDSIDGSGWVRWIDRRLPMALRWFDEPFQPALDEAGVR